MQVQRLLGSDIAMAFDECPPAGVDRAQARGRGAAHGALGASAAAPQPRAEGQLGFGIVQGGIDLELRERSADEIVALGFDGHAVGGLSVGEERGAMLETLAATVEMLPADRPRYLMGVGDPVGLVEAIAARRRHVRLRAAHAARPHRLGARARRAHQPAKRRIRRRPAAARGRLHVPGLRGFSRAYIRHLVTQSEISGLRLLTIHNLHQLLDLAARARAAIARPLRRAPGSLPSTWRVTALRPPPRALEPASSSSAAAASPRRP